MPQKLKTVTPEYEKRVKNFAAWLAVIIAQARLRHEELRTTAEGRPITDAEDARLMGIAHSDWSCIKRGQLLPKEWECLRIARRFDVPVEVVLREAQYPYPDINALITGAEGLPEYPEKTYILNCLRHAKVVSAWRKTASIWKEKADAVLASKLPLAEKAKEYADLVYAWSWDPNRNSNRAHKPTDELPVIAS